MPEVLYKITVKANAIDRLLNFLRGRSRRAQNLRPAWDVIREDFYTHENSLFAAEGQVGAFGPWTPLNPEYARRKQREGFSSAILVRTGRLVASLTNFHSGDSIYRPSAQAVEIGTAVPYAAFHDEGTRNMPAREPIRIDEDTEQRWASIVESHIEGTL